MLGVILLIVCKDLNINFHSTPNGLEGENEFYKQSKKSHLTMSNSISSKVDLVRILIWSFTEINKHVILNC